MYQRQLGASLQLETTSIQKSASQRSPIQFQLKTSLEYDPSLVPVLQNEHVELLALYSRTLASAKAGLARVTQKLLIEFKELLADHILKENISLYIYLRHAAIEPISEEAVESMKSEMDELGTEAMRFLNEFSREGAVYDDRFISEFEEVGNALARRIEHEERHVYPNYRPG